jgi:hypothetical protein
VNPAATTLKENQEQASECCLMIIRSIEQAESN